MALDEFWLVRRSALPADLKYVAENLAVMVGSKRGGDNLFISVAALAKDLGLHRVTVSRHLSRLDKLGIFPVIRRGGRHRSDRTGKVVTHTSRRGFDAEALARFSATHVAPTLHDEAVIEVSSSDTLHGQPTSCSASATNKVTSTSSSKETSTSEDLKTCLKAVAAVPQTVPCDPILPSVLLEEDPAGASTGQILQRYRDRFIRTLDFPPLMNYGRDGTLARQLAASWSQDCGFRKF
jgi:DNA-binding transcriptional regulator YhcF (GntR family)